MKDPIEGLKSSSSKTQNIYAGISDILTLTNPSLDSVKASYSQAVKSLDDTNTNYNISKDQRQQPKICWYFPIFTYTS